MTQSLFRNMDKEPLAILSPCGLYRYTLRRGGRVHGGEGVVNFILLNPSTADATRNDPTIMRCMGYAHSWDYDDLIVTNLFAFRATDPKQMKAATDPVGPDNDAHLLREASAASLVVCGWGAHGALLGRDRAVLGMLREAGIVPHCLARTNGGQPGHPLYLRAELKPVPMEGTGR